MINFLQNLKTKKIILYLLNETKVLKMLLKNISYNIIPQFDSKAILMQKKMRFVELIILIMLVLTGDMDFMKMDFKNCYKSCFKTYVWVLNDK